jgi:NAD-dependent dihydropyrimidine dehydrogenase PreA subunit
MPARVLTLVAANLCFAVRAPQFSSTTYGAEMPYIIAEPCIGLKDRSCVDVCPVDCIYEGEDQLYIHPDECIDCGACEPECPVTAIFPEEDTPPQWKSYIAKNKDVFQGATPPGKPQRKGS